MNNKTATLPSRSWHTKSSEEIFKLLSVEEQGLSNVEARTRLERYGANSFPEVKTDSLFVVFLRQFQSPLIYLLVVAGAMMAYAGDASDAVIIIAVLFLNAIIGTVQEGRAQNTLASLRKFVETRATVLRDRKEVIISDTEIVPGDVIFLQEGERIPADARLLAIHNLSVNEAPLTGESVPAHKFTDTLFGETLPVAERSNMVFKGTHVATGSARAIVVSTGLDTEIGLIAREISVISSDVPLKASIQRLARAIIVVALGIAVTLFSLGVVMGNTPEDMLLMVIALSVSLVPEGLPIVLTLVLATGAWRMGKQNALVKKMHAVEALGQVNILAVDKTGTLTRNEMVIQEVYTDGKTFEIGGIGYESHGDIRLLGNVIDPANHTELLSLGKISTLCSNARVAWSEEGKQWNVAGDPTEAAMLIFGHKLGFHKDILEQEAPLMKEMPFDYTLKYHAVLHKQGNISILSLAGAPEMILDFCTSVSRGNTIVPFDAQMRQEIEDEFINMSRQGLRVIAFAVSHGVSRLPTKETLPFATFVGFVGMRDALRMDVSTTIARAKSAGVRTVMITGDYRVTAQTIAREAGIYHDGDVVLTGNEIEFLNDKELADKIGNISVFARVTPEHKLRIIRAYRALGNLVAMTGDGVNDAPSLSSADLGISMGRIGTEVAKEASDIVLLDDRLESIITAIEEGRSIYRTIKKVILYLFSTSAGEVLTIAGALFLGYIVPILPAQIIWLNFVTDGFLDTALAMEPKDKGLLAEIPHKNARALVDQQMLIRIIVMASTMAVGTLYLFGDYVDTPEKAWTISLTLLAVFQWFNAWNCRSHSLSIFQMNPFSNLFLIGATGIVVALQLYAVYTPLGQKFLHTVPLSLSEWGMIVAIASSIVVVEEVRKFIYRYTSKSKSLMSV